MIQVENINGRTLVLDIDENMQFFSFGITMSAGSSYEKGNAIHGTAHFLEHSLFKGYEGTGHLKLTRLFESLGIEINAFTSKELLHFYIKGLTKNFRKAITPFLNTILFPRITKSAVKKEKEIIKEEIVSYDDDYEELIFEKSDMKMFDDTSYAHPIAGTLKSVDTIELENLEEYHRDVVLKNDMVFSYSGGSVDYSSILNILNILPKRIPNSVRQNLIFPKEYSFEEDIIANTSHILWSIPISSNKLKERINISLFNYILGEGNNSKLFWNIREKMGLTYNIYSSVTFLPQLALNQIYLNLNPTKTKKATSSVNNLIKNLDSLISEKDVNSAKTQLETQLVIDNHDLHSKMLSNSKDILRYGTLYDINTVRDMVLAIKKDDIVEIASQISSQIPSTYIMNGKV